jgi:Dolichyl-phosphate-mannose-protein mannosyltransferase
VIKRPLYALAILLHVGLGLGFLLKTPVLEDADGFSHFWYSRSLASQGEMPLIPGTARALGRSLIDEDSLAHHPPLYYLLLAAVLRATDAHGMFAAPTANENRGVDHPGNSLQWLHGHDEIERISTEVWIFRLLRFVSIVCGVASLWLVRRLADLAIPSRPAAGDLAAFLLAGLPAWNSVHGCLDNGNLALTFCLAATYAIARAVSSERFGWRDSVTIGALIGAALVTKLTTLFLVPLAALILGAAVLRRRESVIPTLRLALVTVLVAALICGWFFVRNAELYGDPLAREAHGRVFAVNRVPEGALFHYLTVGFFPRIFANLFGSWAIRPWSLHVGVGAAVLLAAIAGLFLMRPLADVRRSILTICALGFCGSFALVLQFNIQYIQPQGRYLLPGVALGVIPLAVGLIAVHVRLHRRLAPIATALLALGWAGFAIASLTMRFAPALDPRNAMAEDRYAILVNGAMRDPPTPQLEALEPADQVELTAAPILKWTPSPRPGAAYSIYIYTPTGKLYFAAFEWLRVAIDEPEYAIPSQIWDLLPADVPLVWRVAEIPDRSRGESLLDVPSSTARTFIRRSGS